MPSSPRMAATVHAFCFQLALRPSERGIPILSKPARRQRLDELEATRPRYSRRVTIFFLTDFGTRDVYAGLVEAVMATIAPDARVVHLTHGVPPQDVRNASWQIFAAAPHLPDGSVLLAVVDPGVGSLRRAIAVEGRLRYVGPDNGLFEAALAIDPPRRAVELTDPRYRLASVSSTFHGRDVFGPAAAHLARGVDLGAFGPSVATDALVRLGVRPVESPAGEVWTFDRYGNAITTLSAPRVPPAGVRVGARELTYASHYAAVAPGELLALAGSSGLVEISVREGSAKSALALVEGARVELVP